MKIKHIGLILICIGLLYVPNLVKAQDKLLEIDLGKDKRDMIMYFDLKEKGMLYVTTHPGQLYHFIFVNTDNKVVWESSVGKKEWHSRGEVKVYFSDEYIYYTQLAETFKNGLSILQFNNSGKSVLFENNTNEFGGIKGLFTKDNKLYAVQHKYLHGGDEQVYNFIPFDNATLTPEKFIKINLPVLESEKWYFLGFDEYAYFYGTGKIKSEKVNTTVIPVAITGEVLQKRTLKIEPVLLLLNGRQFFTSPNMVLDPDNHYIYTSSFFNKEKYEEGKPRPYHGIYINKYDLEGELVNENQLDFKELNKIYPDVKPAQYGNIIKTLYLNPTKNSVDILTRIHYVSQQKSHVPSSAYTEVYYYKLDSSLKLKNVNYLSAANPSLDIQRLGLEHNDFLISSILSQTTFREYKDDALIRKLTELTSQAKRLKSNIYKIKYYEEKGIVMEYMAREKILKVHSVNLN